MTRRRIGVTDHAVLRYLERVGGFDIEGLREQISGRISAAAAPGATAIYIDGFYYRIVDDPEGSGPVVATVIDGRGRKTILRPKGGGQ